MSHVIFKNCLFSQQVPGNWKPQENPNAARIKELLDAYKTIASREKVEKDRKKYATPKRRTFHLNSSTGSLGSNLSGLGSFHSEKYGILTPANKRLKELNSSMIGGQEVPQSFESQLKALIKPSKTVDSFEPLVIEDYFSNEMNINSSKFKIIDFLLIGFFFLLVFFIFNK